MAESSSSSGGSGGSASHKPAPAAAHPEHHEHHRHHHRHPRGHLVEIHGVPAHLAFNKHVHRGYRPHGMTLGDAARSVFALTNESFNVWTHVLTVAILAWWLALLLSRAPAEPHYAAVAVCLACGIVCFTGSVVYHLFMPAMETAAQYRRLLFADLVGVWAVNCGIQASVAYLLVPCASPLVKLAMTAVPAVGALLWITIFAPTPALRMAAFGVQLLTRLTIVAVAFAAGWTHWNAATTVNHVWLELSMITGAALNVLRVPERWLPGRLCLTPLQSHTLMHIVASATFLVHHMQSLGHAALVDADAGLLECSRRGAAGLW
jgi:hypothetical protein